MKLLSKWGLCALAGALALVASPAYADDGPSFSFGLRGATDYVWRGVSQSDGKPAVFGTAQVSYNGFYAGAGAENVDFLGIDTEYDLWAGWKGDIGGGATLDVGVVRYGYLDAPSGADLDTVDIKAGLSKTFGPVTLGAVAMYTPDYFATDNPSWYGEVNAAYAVAPDWTVSAAVGHQDIDPSAASYTHWSIGVSYAVADNVTLDLRYHDTDVDNADAFDSRIVAGFSIAL